MAGPNYFDQFDDAPDKTVLAPGNQNKATLEQLQIARQQQMLAEGGDPEMRELRKELLRAQAAAASAAAEKARQGNAGSKIGDTKSQQRNANLDALGNQLLHVRELWEKNLKGGVPNWIAGNIPEGFRPENGAFESAAAGLGEIGLAAFRVPGVGSQSDAELRQFVNANTPKPGDSDLKIEQKLHNLQNRLDSTRKAMGLGEQAPLSGPPKEEITTGETSTRRDPERSAALDAMIRSGVPFSKASQIAKQWGGDSLDSRSYAAAVRYARANPNYRDSLADVTITNPTSAIERGLGKVASGGLGAYGVAAANALTVGTLDELSGNQADGQLAKDLVRQQNPGASLLGDITGSALGMTGLNAGLRGLGGKLSSLATRGGGVGGDMLYGAAYGAGENNEDRLGGAGMGAVAAGVGNAAGRGIVAGGGRLARGVSNPAVRALSDRGVTMTPGQILGGGGVLGKGARLFEDAIESVPFLGAAVRQRKAEGLEGFNREAFNEALAPIGGQADGIGQDAVGQSQELVSDAYGNALDGVSLRADLPFVMRANDAVQAGRRVPEFGSDVDYLARENLGPMFGPGRSLDGEGFQSSMQDIASTKADFNKAGNVRGRNAANSMDDLRQAYFDLASRQAPGTNEGLAAANAANRNVSILGDAVNRQGGDVFTPRQLEQASIANTKKFGGKRAAARGDIPFADLAKSGNAVLPNALPNSGSADRALATFILPSVLGGSAAGSEALNLPAPVTALLAGLAGLSTKTGNRAAQKLLVDRPDAVRAIGEQLMRFRRTGGILGGAGTLTLDK